MVLGINKLNLIFDYFGSYLNLFEENNEIKNYTTPAVSSTNFDPRHLSPTKISMSLPPVDIHQLPCLGKIISDVRWIGQNLTDNPADRSQFNCLDATRTTLSKYCRLTKQETPYKYTSIDFSNSRLFYTNSGKKHGKLKFDPNLSAKAVNLLVTELLNDRIIPIVVSYEGKRASRTNHWITITGFQVNPLTQEIQFTFIDPGTKSEASSTGTFTYNQSTGAIKGACPFKKSRHYELSGIALNPHTRNLLEIWNPKI